MIYDITIDIAVKLPPNAPCFRMRPLYYKSIALPIRDRGPSRRGVRDRSIPKRRTKLRLATTMKVTMQRPAY